MQMPKAENTKSQTPGRTSIRRAAASLAKGKLVILPTETVYGLGADARNDDAVRRIFRAKGRPDFNPLIVHIPDIKAAKALAEFNDTAHTLAKAFWPGPLTLVLPKRADSGLSPAVTAGLETVALRAPAHAVMRAVLRESGLPVAAPSANPSGRLSPTEIDHLDPAILREAEMVLDGGPCERGLESTVVLPGKDSVLILRPGVITAEDITERTGLTATDADGEGPAGIRSPGQLLRHYSPKLPLRRNAVRAEEGEFHIGFGTIKGRISLSPAGDLEEAARNLFAALHAAESSGATAIAIAPIPDEGLGRAINDRLIRAAGKSAG